MNSKWLNRLHWLKVELDSRTWEWTFNSKFRLMEKRRRTKKNQVVEAL
jgi:hypothetical protein